MPEATTINRGRHDKRLTLAAAVVAGEVYQDTDGRAAVYVQIDGADAGSADVKFKTDGQYVVAKKTGEVWVKGDPLWWDRSAGNATCLEPIGASDRDFYLGVATADATSDATTGSVNLNVWPHWEIDSSRDNGDTVIVKTAGAPYLFNRGGMIAAGFDTTAEAQKFDWLSGRSLALAANWVCEIFVEIVTAPDNAAADIDVGMASGTNATNFEDVVQFAAFHFDGDDNNIDAHSDDGVTDVAPTDTTVDWATGTPVRLKLDGRDPNNVKYYVDGVEVLSGTANLGDIDGASNALFAILHAEKTADDSPLELRWRIRVRTMEQD